MQDLQKASLWKRMSAALFDVIILSVVIVGMALLLSVIVDYDSYIDDWTALAKEYSETYQVDLEISAEEREALSPEDKARYEEADKAFAKDERVLRAQGMMVSLMVVIASLSILFGYLLMEFMVPLLLKNGQTFGKKIFGIGVMREDCVKLSGPLLFARAILGKCVVELLLPLAALLALGGAGLILLVAIPLLQVILFFATRAHTPIHDILSHTVTVDFASQRIFDTPEAMLEYKKRLHAEQVTEDNRY